jgi:hypothetical protein
MVDRVVELNIARGAVKLEIEALDRLLPTIHIPELAASMGRRRDLARADLAFIEEEFMQMLTGTQAAA